MFFHTNVSNFEMMKVAGIGIRVEGYAYDEGIPLPSTIVPLLHWFDKMKVELFRLGNDCYL